MNTCARVVAVYLRELAAYFTTPLAYIFLAAFVLLSGFLAFEFGGFFRREQADLLSFFNFHPWLYLVLMPPLAMRIWSEERQTGTIELLMTLPLTVLDAVLGKFLAAWTFVAVALLLTLPMWLTVNYLGSPDNGIIVAAYLGSWLMGGSFLALGGFLSALTKNQVVAFILSTIASLLFLLLGFAPVAQVLQALLPASVAELAISLSFLSHFQSIAKGVVDSRDLGFFLVFMLSWLLATAALIDWKKGA